MSTHPNVMLQCVLTLDEGSRKTERGLLEEFGGSEFYKDEIKIGERHYQITVMESDYEDGYQISAEEGQIVLHRYLTYGYGEAMDFDDIADQVGELQAWAESAKEKHKFSYKVRIGANYW